MSEEQNKQQDNRPKVKILAESLFDSKTQFVMGYEPAKDNDGNFFLDHQGSVIRINKLGGIKVGSVGRIAGHAIKVPRNTLAGYEKVPTLGGSDLVDLIPVYLEEYRKYAWFPSTNAKIVS